MRSRCEKRSSDSSREPGIHSYRWSGSSALHLDTPTLDSCGDMIVGSYGGNTLAGANKNEDGALAACAADGSWEFAAVLDGHHSAESTELVLATLDVELTAITALLAQPAAVAIPAIQGRLLAALGSAAFAEQCRAIRGETACLIVAQSTISLVALHWRLPGIPVSSGISGARAVHPQPA
jgi:hypothetical protein